MMKNLTKPLRWNRAKGARMTNATTTDGKASKSGANKYGVRANVVAVSICVPRGSSLCG